MLQGCFSSLLLRNRKPALRYQRLCECFLKTADTEAHHHSLGSFSKSQQLPSSEMLPTLPQPICSRGGKWTGGEGRQSRGTPGQTETSEILDLSAEKSIWKYFSANTRCCQALLQKYCTQEKNRQENIQLTPSSQDHNGKRFDLPKQTSVSSDKPQTHHQELHYINYRSTNLISSPPTFPNDTQPSPAIVTPKQQSVHQSLRALCSWGIYISS